MTVGTDASAAALLISAPYPEAAVQAIAEAAIEIAEDTVVFASAGLPKWVIDGVVRTGLIQPDLGRRLARRSQFSGSAIYTAGSLEVVRLLARLSGSRRVQRWWMHCSASLFDRSIARRNEIGSAGAVLAMPGAAEATFERASTRRSRRVFHAVNAHPQVHNERLREAYGERARLEMLPLSVVQRVSRELSLATTVLVPSQLVAEQMTSHGVDPQRVVCVPYGAPPLGQRSVAVEVRAGAHRPRALFVGQVGYRKGVPFLLEAVRGMPIDVQLVGPTVAPEVLERLPSNAEYLGPLSNEAVAKLMAAADVFVLPTIEDACALVVAEAAVQGLPVITTEQNGAAELLDGVDCTVVPSADVIALRTSLAGVTPLSADARAARKGRLANSNGIVSWAEYGVRVVRQCRLVAEEA